MSDKPDHVTVTVSTATDRWFCPNCGKPAETTVGRARLLTCASCKWVYEVRLHRYLGPVDATRPYFHSTTEDPCLLCGHAK